MPEMTVTSDSVIGDKALGEILALVRADRSEPMNCPPVPGDSNVPALHPFSPDSPLRQFFDTADTRKHGGTRFSSSGLGR